MSWVHLSAGWTGADGTLRPRVTLEQNATDREKWLAGGTKAEIIDLIAALESIIFNLRMN